MGDHAAASTEASSKVLIDVDLLARLSELPTFVASGILFIASGALLITCANEIFARDPIPVEEQSTNGPQTKLRYENKEAEILRKWCPRIGNFLIFSYLVLFCVFVTSQILRINDANIDQDSFFGVLIASESIYILEIILFPAAVLASSAIARNYVKMRSRTSK